MSTRYPCRSSRAPRYGPKQEIWELCGSRDGTEKRGGGERVFWLFFCFFFFFLGRRFSGTLFFSFFLTFFCGGGGEQGGGQAALIMFANGGVKGATVVADGRSIISSWADNRKHQQG